MMGAVKAAPFRNHSGGKALNPGSTRAAPSYPTTPPFSLTHRHGHHLGECFFRRRIIETEIRFVVGKPVFMLFH